jgi:hypothetical protein
MRATTQRISAGIEMYTPMRRRVVHGSPHPAANMRGVTRMTRDSWESLHALRLMLRWIRSAVRTIGVEANAGIGGKKIQIRAPPR